MKNKNAKSLVKLRWSKTTPEERKKIMEKVRKNIKERKRDSKGRYIKA